MDKVFFFSNFLKRNYFGNVISKLKIVTLSNKRHRKVKLHSASGVQFVTPDIFLNMAQSMFNVEPTQCSHHLYWNFHIYLLILRDMLKVCIYY